MRTDSYTDAKTKTGIGAFFISPEKLGSTFARGNSGVIIDQFGFTVASDNRFPGDIRRINVNSENVFKFLEDLSIAKYYYFTVPGILDSGSIFQLTKLFRNTVLYVIHQPGYRIM